MRTAENIYRHLGRRWGVSAVQARAMGRAAAFFFVFVAGVTVFKSATNGLFLARRDPSELPYLYLATALVVTTVTVGLGRRLARASARSVLVATVWWVAGVMTAFAFLAATGFAPVYGVLYVGGEAYATAVNVLFWARLGEIFDVRSAKRVFGFIGAAGMGGMVAGGVAVRILAPVVPSEAWCFVAMVALVTARPLLGRRAAGAVDRRSSRFRQGLKYAARDRFPRGLALLVLLLAVQSATIDYVFRVGAAAVYATDEASLTGLFGLLNAVVGVAALVVHGFGTGPMLRRFGVFAFLSIIPVLSAFTAAGAIVRPDLFGWLFALKSLEMMGSMSLNQPALSILYNPMPLPVRDAVRAVVDGAVKKMGGAVGGVLLLVLGAVLPGDLLLCAVIAGAALLVWRIYRLRPRYLSALAAKLAQDDGRRFVAIDPADRSTRQRLLTALGADDAGTVLRALDILARHRGPDLALYLVRLLTHPKEAVRSRAIALIEETPHPRYAPHLEAVIRSDSSRPKAQAARALELVDRGRAVRVLQPILALEQPALHQDPGLVCAAVRVGLAADRPTALRAARVLQDLLARSVATSARTGATSATGARLTEMRRELARLLGRIGSGPTAARLGPLLADSDLSVRQLAVASAAVARHSALPPRLVPLLQDTDLRKAAHGALASYGDSAVGLLSEVLSDPHEPTDVRLRVPRILRDVGTETAARAMLEAQVDDVPSLRFATIQSMFRLRRDRPDVTFDRDRVQQVVLRSLADYRYFADLAGDLTAGGSPYALVARAVRNRLDQNLVSVIMLLGLVCDFKAVERSVAGIRAGLVPDALELLDVTLQGDELRKVVIRGLDVPVRTAVPAAAAARASELAKGEDRPLARLAYRSLARADERLLNADEVREEDLAMPDLIIDRLFILEGVKLFQGLSVDALTQVASLARPGRAEPHEVIYREGELSDAMYVVVAGEVRLYKEDRPIIELHPGDSFGQVSMLDRGVRPVTARAQDEGLEYLVLDRAPFMDLVFDDPALIDGMFGLLARRLRELVDLTATTIDRRGSTTQPALRQPTVRGSTTGSS